MKRSLNWEWNYQELSSKNMFSFSTRSNADVQWNKWPSPENHETIVYAAVMTKKHTQNMKHLGTTWNLQPQLCVLQCVSFHQHHLKKFSASNAVKSDTDCNKKPSCDTQDPSIDRQRLPRFPWQQHLPSRHRVKTAECAMKSIKAGLGDHGNHGEIMGEAFPYANHGAGTSTYKTGQFWG